MHNASVICHVMWTREEEGMVWTPGGLDPMIWLYRTNVSFRLASRDERQLKLNRLFHGRETYLVKEMA